MKNEKRSLAAAAFLITSTLAAPTNAMTPVEQAQAFATCAGRFSAVATRQNAKHDPGHQASREIEHSFLFLLDATRPAIEAHGIDHRTLRQWRASGWMEMAQLMRLQQRHADTDHARKAERDMHQRLSTCQNLIL